jgi:hypothetical protein
LTVGEIEIAFEVIDTEVNSLDSDDVEVAVAAAAVELIDRAVPLESEVVGVVVVAGDVDKTPNAVGVEAIEVKGGDAATVDNDRPIVDVV